MKKNGGFILRVIFGLMGVVYAVLGMAFLVIAAKAAGHLSRIFTLPEEQLAFAVNGVVFTVLGAGFLLVTAMLIVAGKKHRQMREELLQFGTRVTGEVVEVRTNHAVRINRRSPLVAKVKCVFSTGEVILKSKNLWTVCPAVGDAVEVIYDPMDEKRYVIEFEEK